MPEKFPLELKMHSVPPNKYNRPTGKTKECFILRKLQYLY